MTPWLPGATLGILGGGQLGWMIGLAAQRMGYRLAVLDPAADSSAGRIADHFIQARFDDADAVRALALASDLVTLETEHIPYSALQPIEAIRPLRPGADVFRVVQDRVTQRAFLRDGSFPQARCQAIVSSADLELAAAIGFPAVLKSSTGGYDGKGQAKVHSVAELTTVWQSWGQIPCVLEAFIPFVQEVSVILARDIAGNVAVYPLAENIHREHILSITVAPARCQSNVADRARDIAMGIAQKMQYIGVMAVEMFVLADGDVLVNEIAPRVHNSGHYTFGACATSQFEQHVRAVCGLPLGDAELYRPAVMLNLLGDAWAQPQPKWEKIFALNNAKLFLYGKQPTSPKRKIGHVLLSGDDTESLIKQAQWLDAELCGTSRDV